MLTNYQYDETAHREKLSFAFRKVFESNELTYFDEFLDSGLSHVMLDENNDVQAFVLVQETPECVGNYEIAFLGVCSDYRKKGYAKFLVEIVLQLSGNKGVWLNVLRSNVPACNLYKKLKFDESEKFVSDLGEPAVRFTWGIQYSCYDCKTVIKPSETIWERLPTSYTITLHGPKQVLTLESLCFYCRTRVEP